MEGETQPGEQPFFEPSVLFAPSAPSAPAENKLSSKPKFVIVRERRTNISSHNYDIIIKQIKEFETGKSKVPLRENVKKLYNVVVIHGPKGIVTYGIDARDFLYIRTLQNQYLVWEK